MKTLFVAALRQNAVPPSLVLLASDRPTPSGFCFAGECGAIRRIDIFSQAAKLPATMTYKQTVRKRKFYACIYRCDILADPCSRRSIWDQQQQPAWVKWDE
jgi:hypothetical protein